MERCSEPEERCGGASTSIQIAGAPVRTTVADRTRLPLNEQRFTTAATTVHPVVRRVLPEQTEPNLKPPPTASHLGAIFKFSRSNLSQRARHSKLGETEQG